MAYIITKKGEEILIDDSLFDELSNFTWYVNKMGYAANDAIPRKTMHRLILEYPSSNIDHINGNKLDNRKENLRLCNQSQNTMNTSKRKTNKSGFKGVSWNKKYGKWEAYLTINYKHIFLGYFSDKLEAAIAYNTKALDSFGEFAKLNQI